MISRLLKPIFTASMTTAALCSAIAGGKDVNGNDVTGSTLFGDIDGTNCTVRQLFGDEVSAGYWKCGPWTNNIADVIVAPDTLSLLKPPSYNGDNGNWSIRWVKNESSASPIIGESSTTSPFGEFTTNLTFAVDGDSINFWRIGYKEYLTNTMGLATLENLNAYVTKPALENMDTSYVMTTNITDQNQSIQVVVIEENAPNPSVNIKIPKDGQCKDWVVYVVAFTNAALVLPPGNYYVPDEATTNDITDVGVMTALYFTQVLPPMINSQGQYEEAAYAISRRTLMPVKVEAPVAVTLFGRMLERHVIANKREKKK